MCSRDQRVGSVDLFIGVAQQAGDFGQCFGGAKPHRLGATYRFHLHEQNGFGAHHNPVDRPLVVFVVGDLGMHLRSGQDVQLASYVLLEQRATVVRKRRAGRRDALAR
jgi:hypothetical protein